MSEPTSLPPFLLLEPQYRDYVWGGHRLRPSTGITAEAWVVYEEDKVASVPCQGSTLAELAERYEAALLGSKAFQETGRRFPLLIKLLDCAEWLSIQVHPNDEQAVQLEGSGHFGKTEAWHTLEADPGACIIAGIKHGFTPEDLRQAIRDGTVEGLCQYLPLQRGDTVFMRPGTLHALGPGLLIYEVQQTSDLTYRVYDWGRPASDERQLHIEQSLVVTRHDARAEFTPLPVLKDGEERRLCTSGYFTLSMIAATTRTIHLGTRGESFHALTVSEGRARLVAGAQSVELERFDTVLVPAATGSYQIEPQGVFRALKSTT